MDTCLQMIFFLWIRLFVPHSVRKKHSLLLENLTNLRNGDCNKAHHDFLIGRTIPYHVKLHGLGNKIIKVHKDGNTGRWNGRGDLGDYKHIPELFETPQKMRMTYGHCSEMGESCHFHDFFKRNK